MNTSSTHQKKPISLGIVIVIVLIAVMIGIFVWKTQFKNSYKTSSKTSQTSIETKGLINYILKTNHPQTILEIEPSDLTSQIHDYCKDYNEKNYAALENQNPRMAILTVGNYIHKSYAPLANKDWHHMKINHDESISRLVRSSDGWNLVVLPSHRLRDIVDARKHANVVIIRNASKNNQHLQKIIQKYKTATFVEPDAYLLTN